ncbi:hypothetical protein PBAL39_10051 [Pedobacter sp. BAL39]|nr:hypothetical protein PBAL39_10051 [Pedobacter sp. BAL39]
MGVILEFFAVVLGQYLLDGIGGFVRRLFRLGKPRKSRRRDVDLIDIEAVYNRLVGILVIFIAILLAALLFSIFKA